MSAPGTSLQERFAPDGRCFGCGPANPSGLRIRSIVDGEELVAVWTPRAEHEAFEGIVNGGIIGTLLDCHSNWAAAYQLMLRAGADRPPSTVTADFAVRLRRPTPSRQPLTIRARVTDATVDRATVLATIEAGGVTTATCESHFVAVGPGHPAYGRW